ncbi:unnamed protein product [Adineta steineri]|nr:unnamed protein product [Adineta steineri]
MEHQYINPTTQVALFSACTDNYGTIENITWSIYQGSINSSTSMNTSNFTATNQLFINNPLIIYWCCEVVYSSGLKLSSSAINFIINQPPERGSCSIDLINGTTSTLFTISCFNWFDKDNLNDYSFYNGVSITTISISSLNNIT